MVKMKRLSLMLLLVSLCVWFLSASVLAQEITIGFAMKTLTNPFFTGLTPELWRISA